MENADIEHLRRLVEQLSKELDAALSWIRKLDQRVRSLELVARPELSSEDVPPKPTPERPELLSPSSDPFP